MTVDEKAWHDFRRQGVGASDISALIGLSRYASPTSLYYEKLGLLEPDEETQRQRIGKRMEALLAAEFHDETGLYVVGEQTWVTHPEHTFARCTLDGLVSESPTNADLDSVIATWEAKSDGRFGWPDGIPHNIRAQCVFQMGVTSVRHCFLTVMFAGFNIKHYEIPFDDEARSDWLFMLDAARTFWTQHVLTGTPPPVDDHDATVAALTEIYRPAEGPCPTCGGSAVLAVCLRCGVFNDGDPCANCGGPVDGGPCPDCIDGTVSLVLKADDRARELVATVQRAMAITAAAEATEKRWKNELRALLADKTDLVDGWKTVGKRDPKQVPIVIASWREQQSHRIDPELVRTLVPPDLVAKCTTTTTQRKLVVPKAKETSE